MAEAYAKSHARFAQIATNEAAVRSSLDGFHEDFDRLKERAVRTVLPIELLDNFRLLARARRQYLDAIVDYNRSQFELFVALGQPPAGSLAHPVPADGIAPSGIPGPPAPESASTGRPAPVPPGTNLPAAASVPAVR